MISPESGPGEALTAALTDLWGLSVDFHRDLLGWNGPRHWMCQDKVARLTYMKGPSHGI
jgi:hypothetical protein